MPASESIRPVRAEGPSVWTARDLERDRSWLVELSPAQADEIARAAASLPEGGDVLREDAPAWPQAPDWLGPLLERVRAELGRRGVVLLRGLPVTRLSRAQAGRLFRAIGERMGTALTQNTARELLSPVTDDGARFGYDTGAAQRARGYRSSAQLNMHADPTDVVALMCLRQARSGGLSSIVSAGAVHNALLDASPAHLPVLYRGFRYDRKGEEGPGEAPVTGPIPVFERRGARLDCRYARSYIAGAADRLGLPLTPDERAALDAFDAAARRDDLAALMDFEPGDVQWLDNLAVLHGRTAFEDGPDPAERRYLYRLWLQMGDHAPWQGASDAMRWAYARFGALGRTAREAGAPPAPPH
ncbi:MAG: TauD/TfdA family dioxygenase [Burkholderiales bacterium]